MISLSIALQTSEAWFTSSAARSLSCGVRSPLRGVWSIPSGSLPGWWLSASAWPAAPGATIDGGEESEKERVTNWCSHASQIIDLPACRNTPPRGQPPSYRRNRRLHGSIHRHRLPCQHRCPSRRRSCERFWKAKRTLGILTSKSHYRHIVLAPHSQNDKQLHPPYPEDSAR